MDNTRIAVYGAGSLGTIVGAFLAKAGEDVTLIDAWEENVDKLNTDGATVTGAADFTAPVKAVLPKNVTGKFDLILLLTKQVQNGEVVSQIKEVLADEGTLVSLQNGLPEKYITSQIDPAHVVAGSVQFAAGSQGAGVSELKTDYATFKALAFKIGELDGSDTERIEHVKNILDGVGGTEVSANLIGTKWAKLLLNASFSGLAAALNATFGDILENDVATLAALHILDEGVRTAEADGVTLEQMNGVDPTYFKEPEDGFTKEQVAKIREIMAPSKDVTGSLLLDLEKQRKTEVHQINGVIADTAEGYSIATPFNDFVIKTVEVAEATGDMPIFMVGVNLLKEML